MTIHPVELRGEGAHLVPLGEAHAPGLLAALEDLEVWKYLPRAPLLSLDDSLAFVREAMAEQADGTALPFAIINQETERIVGSTRLLDISVAHRHGEIGWTWLSPSVWRTRINTECKYLLLCHCFETLGMIRVQLKTDARNERSQRAIERIGAVREGVLRRVRIMPDGFRRDSVYYSIIAEEWPQTKARLEGLLAGNYG